MPKCDFCDKDAVATIRYHEKDNDIFYVRNVCDKCLDNLEENIKIIKCTYFDKTLQAKYEASKAATQSSNQSTNNDQNSTSSIETTSGLDSLFSNPGNNIKTLAKILFIIGLVIGVIGAIVCWVIGGNMRYGGETLTGIGFAVLFAVPIGSWVSSLFLYGFGQLIENTEEIKNNTKK